VVNNSVTYSLIDKYKNMKQTITAALLLWQLAAHAQQAPAGQQWYKEGREYLQGVARPYNPPKAKAAFAQAAAAGHPQAANALAGIYLMGTGCRSNVDSALHWYRAAAQNGYGNAYYNLGNVYKMGLHTPQNFALAASYFAEGAKLNDVQSHFMLAYMHFKGMGAAQDYAKAYSGFVQAAASGSHEAMYFAGLCLRNGYGVLADKEAANQWLQKAAAAGNRQAKQELKEALPENVSAVSPYLQQQLGSITAYKEKFTPAAVNDYGGSYTGWAVYYDWSGKYVSEILPLKVELAKTAAGYTGFWQEGQSQPAPISIQQSGGLLAFNTGCSYQRSNHYSGRQPEQWQFNNARLSLGFSGDSVLLNGYVQFYSAMRMEPCKPLQIILKKAIDQQAAGAGGVPLSLYPNPASSTAQVQFTLAATAKVYVKVMAAGGTVQYTEAERKLPAGTYNYALPVSSFTPGTYMVQLVTNGKPGTAKALIKQ
jgi:uncharacterized protein